MHDAQTVPYLIDATDLGAMVVWQDDDAGFAAALWCRRCDGDLGFQHDERCPLASLPPLDPEEYAALVRIADRLDQYLCRIPDDDMFDDLAHLVSIQHDEAHWYIGEDRYWVLSAPF